jgi:integrase
MEREMKLAKVIKMTPPTGKDIWKADDEIKGLGVRYQNGRGVYTIRYSVNGKDRRLAFQSIDRVTLEAAWQWAREQFAAIGNNVDPAIERAQGKLDAVDTLGDLIPKYFKQMEKNNRAASYIRESRRSLERYFSTLHPFQPDQINKKMVSRQLNIIRDDHGDIAANRCRSHLSALYGWLCREDHAEGNPVENTNTTEETPRDRLLTDVEIKLIWNALLDDNFGSIMKLLFMTGSRKSEIADLTRNELDLEHQYIVLPRGRTKAKLEHLIPLSESALSIVQKNVASDSFFLFGQPGAAGGFSGWSRSKRRLDAIIKIEPWTIHDTRRYVSTVLHERLNIEPHVIESILGHVVPGIAGVYNRSQYSLQKREALNRLSEHILQITNC